MILAYLWLPIALLIAAAYLPAAHARVIVTGRLAAGFDVRANLAFIRRNLRNYGLLYVLAIVASLLSNAGLLLCGVGLYPATIWSVVVIAWAQGELVRCDPAFR
jgi:hypothetical protein